MRQKKPTPLVRVLGITTILVALYAILFGGMPIFSNESAEHILSEMATHVSSEASQRGGEARLQYSDVEIKGLAYDKWARVSNLALDFLYQQWQGHTRLGLSTASADVIPDHTSASRVTLRFGEAVNLIAGSELLAIVQPVGPAYYVINYKPIGMKDTIRHRLLIPGDLDVTTLEPKQSMHINIPSPALLDTSFFGTDRRLQSKLLTGIVRILSQDESWGLESSDIRYESVQKGMDMVESKGTFTVDRLYFSRAGTSTPPYTVTSGWAMKAHRNISGAVDSSRLDIDQGLITNGEIKISMNGSAHFDIDDAPYGDLVLEISNPVDFIKSGWIAKDKQALATALLDEILGEKIGGHKQAIINIVRAKNGTWKVGKMPLDELLDKGFLSIFIFNAGEQHDESSQETSPS